MNNRYQLNFSMSAGIRFNRPLTADDYISPGGYEMSMNGKYVRFDFHMYAGSINKKDPYLADFLMTFPDSDSFYDLVFLSVNDLETVSSLEDFFVDTRDSKDSDLYAVGLDYLTFTVSTPRPKDIIVSKEILDTAKITESIHPSILTK